MRGPLIFCASLDERCQLSDVILVLGELLNDIRLGGVDLDS